LNTLVNFESALLRLDGQFSVGGNTGGAGTDNLDVYWWESAANYTNGTREVNKSYSLDGGDDDDTINVMGSFNKSYGQTTVSALGGTGNDTITVSDNIAGDTGTQGQNYGIAKATLSGGEGDDTLTVGGVLGATLTGGTGADKFVLTAQQYRTIVEGSRSIANSNGTNTTVKADPVTITDFAVGAGGDVLDYSDLLRNGTLSYDGSNPFGSGFLKLEQSGADTLLSFDADGTAGGNEGYVVLAVLKNVSASNLVSGNFNPNFELPGGSTNQAPVLTTPAAITYTDTAGNDTFTNKTVTLAATDADNDTLTYGVSGGTVANGVSSKQGSYGTLSVNTSTGSYTFATNDAAIEGIKANTSETFTVTVGDGKATVIANLDVNLTGANDAPAGTVTISGTPNVGQTLTASNSLTDAEGMGVVGYQWYAAGVAIAGATSGSYSLQEDQLGKTITVKASYTDGGGFLESVLSAPTGSVEVGKLPPTISLTAPDLELEPGQSSLVTFTLSEPSLDFTALDVSATGGRISNFSGSGTQYQATFTPTALAKGGAVFVDSEKFRDVDGLWNQDGSDLDNVLTYSMYFDKAPPTISLTSSKTILSSGESATITFRLSEPVKDFTLSDMTVKGGTLSNFRGSGTTFYATFTADSASTSAAVYVPTNKFTDLSGNLNKDGFETNNIVTMAIANAYKNTVNNTVLSSDSITADNVINLAEGVSTSLTVTGKVTGEYSPGDVVSLQLQDKTYVATVATNGSFSVPVAMDDLKADADTKIEVTVTGSGGAVVSGELDYSIETDNARSSSIIVNDEPQSQSQSPTVNLSSSKTSLNVGENAVISFTLSDSSVNFKMDDVTVVGGTLSDFRGSGTSYTATFTPSAGVTDSTLSVSSDRFSDLSGKMNKDGADADNTVRLNINNGNGMSLDRPANGSGGSATNSLTDPENVFNINLSQVLSNGIITSGNERLLTIDGNENDIVNLSNLLDNGQNTGQWQSNMAIEFNQNSYKFWTHSGNPNAGLLIDESIQNVNFV
jgi:hypothetical protein